MIVRTAILAAYAAVLAAALLVQFLYPALGTLVFYGLLFWLVASFFLFRLPSAQRPVPGRSAPGPGGALGSGPGASSPLPSGPPVHLEFCAFCGSALPEGAERCPTCRHEVRAF